MIYEKDLTDAGIYPVCLDGTECPGYQRSFFEKADYIGAFATFDWTQGWTNCDSQNTVYPATTVVIKASDMTTNTTWTAGNVYLLNGWVYVKTAQPSRLSRGRSSVEIR